MTIEISHEKIILITGINGTLALGFCVIGNLLGIPFEKYLIELLFIEFFQILLIIISGRNKPPPAAPPARHKTRNDIWL